MDDRYLIVGLGNPGREHNQQRHNIGFMAIDQLAAAHNFQGVKVQNRAIVQNGRIGPKPVILAKPQTYMNRSGDAIGPLANFYKIPPAQILVIYDELDLPFGTIRLRASGSSGGHNGMKSLIAHLGDGFARMRLGIGRPPGQMPAYAYVLQDFGKADQPLLREMLDTAVRATETFIDQGIQLAMSRFNGTVTT